MTPQERKKRLVSIATELFAKQRPKGVRLAIGAVLGAAGEVQVVAADDGDELADVLQSTIVSGALAWTGARHVTDPLVGAGESRDSRG